MSAPSEDTYGVAEATVDQIAEGLEHSSTGEQLAHAQVCATLALVNAVDELTREVALLRPPREV